MSEIIEKLEYEGEQEADYGLEEVKEELEYLEEYLDKKLKDVKFGTNLQRDIIGIVLKFAERYGVRFEVLDSPKTAEEITKDLGHDIELANQIGDILVSYFEE